MSLFVSGLTKCISMRMDMEKILLQVQWSCVVAWKCGHSEVWQQGLKLVFRISDPGVSSTKNQPACTTSKPRLSRWVRYLDYKVWSAKTIWLRFSLNPPRLQLMISFRLRNYSLWPTGCGKAYDATLISRWLEDELRDVVVEACFIAHVLFLKKLGNLQIPNKSICKTTQMVNQWERDHLLGWCLGTLVIQGWTTPRDVGSSAVVLETCKHLLPCSPLSWCLAGLSFGQKGFYQRLVHDSV